MQKVLMVLTIIISGSALVSCNTPAPDSSAALNPTFTMREIMQSLVEPRADSLWNAVSIAVTEKGIETNAPETDEEWAAMRHEAVTLSEAMNLILMPGRVVAKPGEEAKDPTVELSPEEITKLIDEDRQSFAEMAHSLQDTVMKAIQAIDAKDAEALSNAGGDIDAACEACHKKYWYPNDPGATPAQ